MRKHNTTLNGAAWPESTKLAVWEKGTIIPGYPKDVWRRDKCGAVMKYSDHGDRTSKYGWVS